MENEKEKQGAETEISKKATLMSFHQNDGSLVITFTDNDLEARADFIPPLGDGTPLTMDYITAALEKFNIVYGIRWEIIQETSLQLLGQGKPIRDILIARGDLPVPEVTEYFELDSSLQQKELPEEDIPRIDYRSISPYTIVKKGQTLARRKQRVSGKEGKDVHGNSIPMPYVRPQGVSAGKYCELRDEQIVAETDGRLLQDKGVLNIEQILIIKGSVGYGTGHIKFPGDIILEGEVADGFKIYSGGSVIAKQTFDVTDVVAKKDIIVSGGIIGRGRALVKAGGGLRAKFIQNCRIACRDTITVESEIVNSSIYTLKRLELGDKGRILGGEIYAVHGIRAASIGKQSGKTTRIHCGIDFTVQQEKERHNIRLRMLSAKLARVKEIIEQDAQDGERQEKMEELAKQLQEEFNKSASKLSELMANINSDENATVEVKGEIAPGTLIEICEVALFVESPLKKVRIKLDKNSGKLLSESL